MRRVPVGHWRARFVAKFGHWFSFYLIPCRSPVTLEQEVVIASVDEMHRMIVRLPDTNEVSALLLDYEDGTGSPDLGVFCIDCYPQYEDSDKYIQGFRMWHIYGTLPNLQQARVMLAQNYGVDIVKQEPFPHVHPHPRHHALL